MRIGKLSNEDLERLVLSHVPFIGTASEAGPSVGLDCAVMDIGDGISLVLSSDPVTAAESDAGRLAIQISCNDIAASGVRPSGIMVVLIVPPDCTEERIAGIMKQTATAAAETGVRIAGGHTEVSDAVNRVLITTTAFGWTRGKVVLASGAKPGDTLLMSKTAGLEGTAILARDRQSDLEGRLTPAEFLQAFDMIGHISVVTEGTTGASLGVHAMHDATEGGILGACWELCRASGAGCLVRAGDIPVHPVTSLLSGIFHVDPLRLISSGSMIFATDRPEGLIAALGQAGIPCTAIGTVAEGECNVLMPDGIVQKLEPPGADELYKTASSSYY